MNESHQEKNQEVSFLIFWQIFIRNIWFISVTTTLFFVFSLIYSFYIVTPDYKSNADVMVQVEQNSPSSLDPNYDLVNAFRLIDTVAELMEKEVILENAIERLKNIGYQGLSVIYLREGLSVKSSPTSYFINISFVDKNTNLAEDAVDAVIEAIIEETDIADAFPVLTNKIRRTSFATDAIYNSPNKVFFAIAGFLLGGFISTGIVITKEFFSSRFRSKEEIESVLKIQVLGVIPLKELKESNRGKKKK